MSPGLRLMVELEGDAKPGGPAPETRRDVVIEPDGSLTVFLGFDIAPGVALGARLREQQVRTWVDGSRAA